MTTPNRVLVTAALVLACAVMAPAAPQAQPPQQQEEFIPIDQLPPQEQLPAAPLLIGAYAFVLAVLFAYIVSVSRRLSAIQREVDRLDADLKRNGRG